MRKAKRPQKTESLKRRVGRYDEASAFQEITAFIRPPVSAPFKAQRIFAAKRPLTRSQHERLQWGGGLRCAEERRTTGARHAASTAVRRQFAPAEQSVIKACMHIEFPDRTSWSKTKNIKENGERALLDINLIVQTRTDAAHFKVLVSSISACGAVKSRCMDPVPRRPPRQQERQDKIACNHMSSPAPRCCAEDASLFKDRHSEKRRSGHV